MSDRFYASIDPHHAVIVTVAGDPPLDTPTPQVALDLSKFQNGRWALQLDSLFAHRHEPAVILAQGVACLAVAWWAQLSPRSYLEAVRGAIFRSPLDIGFGQEGIAAAARLGPSTRLPFPSIVTATGYPFMDRVVALADARGSHLVATDTTDYDAPTNRRAQRSAQESQLIGLLPLIDRRLQPLRVRPGFGVLTTIHPR